MTLRHALLALLLLATPVFAHEFQRDGDVGALLHIEPDDSPVVGKATTAWFETTRRGGSPVTATLCTCTVSLYRGAYKAGAKPVSRAAAREGTAGEAKGKLAATLTFPEVGAYTLVLDGKPKGVSDLKSFHLEWVVRAETTPGGHGHE